MSPRRARRKTSGPQTLLVSDRVPSLRRRRTNQWKLTRVSYSSAKFDLNISMFLVSHSHTATTRHPRRRRATRFSRSRFTLSESLCPELGVHLSHRPALYAPVTMPIATINKYHGPPASQNDIRTSGQVAGNKAEAKPEPVEDRANDPFGLCVTAPNAGHDRAPLLLRIDVGHPVVTYGLHQFRRRDSRRFRGQRAFGEVIAIVSRFAATSRAGSVFSALWWPRSRQFLPTGQLIGP